MSRGEDLVESATRHYNLPWVRFPALADDAAVLPPFGLTHQLVEVTVGDGYVFASAMAQQTLVQIPGGQLLGDVPGADAREVERAYGTAADDPLVVARLDPDVGDMPVRLRVREEVGCVAEGPILDLAPMVHGRDQPLGGRGQVIGLDQAAILGADHAPVVEVLVPRDVALLLLLVERLGQGVDLDEVAENREVINAFEEGAVDPQQRQVQRLADRVLQCVSRGRPSPGVVLWAVEFDSEPCDEAVVVSRDEVKVSR